ncbi:MAG: hypothetical protein H6831_06300 [Planctomycetes bacterium]|nr:hypothetical protein [Planctomycetota bacterium]MCB9903999.1 hypothetical protein [Planctomycetota bacterium]
MRSTPLLAAALLAALSPLAPAQEVIAPGFAVVSSAPPAVAFAPSDTLADGSRVYFDGFSVDLYDPAGAFVQNLGSTPAFVFAAFVEVDPTETFAIVAESSGGAVYKAMLDGSGMAPLSTIQFSFDAVFENANDLLVSAAHFGVGNDILRLDTTTGAFTQVAVVPGWSGPLDLAPNGDLIYGESSVAGGRVLRFEASELTGPLPLDELDADVLTDGLDGAASLAVDPVFGNIFVTSNVWAVSGLLLELDADGEIVDTIASGTNWLTELQFVADSGPGHFHRYQPTGLRLRYSNGTDDVTLAPQQPILSHEHFGNYSTIHVTGAVPNAGALILFGNQSYLVAPYSQQLAFDFLYHSDLEFSRIRRLGLRIPTDANGEASFSYFNPGGSTLGQRWFQLLITDANNLFVGASNSVVN